MSSKNDLFGDRMKGYENVSRNYLKRRTPVIIRIDGKAFHTFTRGLKKPFDRILMSAMQETMKYLCANIQGCVFGYTQSDEITLVLTDYATTTTDAWFGYNIQKVCSVAASIATMAFNKFFSNEFEEAHRWACEPDATDDDRKYAFEILYNKLNNAMFDARCFNIPKEEVCNCLIWRQKDAIRNSIESVGHANFSQNKLNGKSCNEIQDMLVEEFGINWNNFPVDCKQGSCCYRVNEELAMKNPRCPEETVVVSRRVWKVDTKPPIFTHDRDYIEKWL